MLLFTHCLLISCTSYGTLFQTFGIVYGKTILIDAKLYIGIILGQQYTIGISAAGMIQQQTGTPQTLPSQYQASEAPVTQWQIHSTSDVSEFLRTMNKERMHLEQQLSREEETSIHKVVKEQVRLNEKFLASFVLTFIQIMILTGIFSRNKNEPKE